LTAHAWGSTSEARGEARKMKELNSMFLIVLLAASAAPAIGVIGFNGFAAAQGGTEPFVHVGWNVTDDVQPIEHEVQNSQWIFGPQPHVWIGYADNWVWNDTDIAERSFRVEADDQLLVNISVPYAFLPEGAILDTVNFWGQTFGDTKAVFGLQYNATSQAWNSASFSYVPGSDVPPEPGFLTLNSTHSVFANSSERREYNTVFAIVFNEEVVQGIFWTGMQVVDTEGRPVSPSWLARIESGTFETPPIGLGIHVPSSEFKLPRYYYAEVIDDDGNLLHYVDYGDNFTLSMRANVPLGEVMIPFCLLTVDQAYWYNYNWTTPRDPTKYLTQWDSHIGMPLFLVFQYNSTGAYALPGYLDNVTWFWVPAIGQWSVSFDVLLNHTLDISPFYSSENIVIEHGGAQVSWRGHFEELTDMNMDPYDVSATIRPDPYFWTVLDQRGEPLTARQEIKEKNTVQLAFRSQFIEAFVRDPSGNIVERALKNQILNVTLVIHSPAGKVNGSYYVFVNKTGVVVDNTTIDIDGVLINRLRQNITLSFEGGGIWNNETHVAVWSVRHNITIDLIGGGKTCSSLVRGILSFLNGTVIADVTFPSTTMFTCYEWDWDVAESHSELWATLSFSDEAPSVKIGKAVIYSGYRDDYAMNVSLAGQNNFSLYDPPISVSTGMDRFEENILWSPRRLLIGDLLSWEQPVWTVTEDGALDLDGNAFTTDDQYYVLRTGTWHDWGNITREMMEVRIMFDPSPGVPGDQFFSRSWMGVATMLIEFEATEGFYWYHSSDWSPVGPDEMNEIRDAMWAVEGDLPAPGYEWIAWTSINRTIDLSGIPALSSGYWSNSWFAWGTAQAFQVSSSATHREYAAFVAQYAGLLLFRDLPAGTSQGAPDFQIVDGQVVTDEVTHFVLIDSIGSVQFRRPLNSTNDSGSEVVAPSTELDFSVTISDVNVTIYPLRVQNSEGIRGAWQLRQSYEGAVGLNATEFDYWVTRAHIEEMSFDISFHVDMVRYDPGDSTKWNHAVSFKISQQFGEWTLYDFDNSVLEGRSLAVNFFGILGTATRTEYRAGGVPVSDTNGASVNGSYYEFRAANSPFANVTMGGLPYTWGGDGHTNTYISGSSTAPVGAFGLMYESASGDTVTDWRVQASMLFMTAGYDHWGGREIICDPVFVSYTSAYQTPSTTTTTTTTTTTPTTTGTTTDTATPLITAEMGMYILIGGTVAVIVIAMVFVRRR